MTPCYYCENRECDACIQGEADPEDVRKGLAMLAEARKIAAGFRLVTGQEVIVAVHRRISEL